MTRTLFAQDDQLHGYPRSDGRAGFRNRVLIMPLTGCQMEAARRIARDVPGATCFAHANGCDFQGGDFHLFGRILEGAVTHPNVGGVVFLAMGCASSLSLRLPTKARDSGRLVDTLATHRGTSQVVAEGVRRAREMAAQLAAVERTPVPFSALTVGTKCGASDPNSFEHCHPVVGRACDELVERGATVVLSEDCEMVGCGRELAMRAADPSVAERIMHMVDDVNAGWKARFGQSFEYLCLKTYPSREAWVTRSLAHCAKAGTTPVRGIFDVGESVAGPGLVILNAPNTDLESVTSLAAAGCHVTLFTTGRGTPVGSPLSTTLKITATQKTWEQMEENIDLCVAPLARGEESLDDAAARVVRAVIAAANGCASKAEQVGHWEVAIPIAGVTY